ncbi:hypothetical protein EQZ20_22605 [Bacillus glycinifermentans]|uniref:Uncharacterized protein n=1 Tax=Bacillus glycinifermentans TaxID=1664069 RepID=A0AAJ4D4C4_9BACI|nr:hypothetical protein EQZ20_22605 [Bacillus glycinifermentans]
MYVSTIFVIENKHVIHVFTTNHTSHYKQKKTLYATFIPVNSIIFTTRHRQKTERRREAGEAHEKKAVLGGNAKEAGGRVEACPPALSCRQALRRHFLHFISIFEITTR